MSSQRSGSAFRRFLGAACPLAGVKLPDPSRTSKANSLWRLVGRFRHDRSLKPDSVPQGADPALPEPDFLNVCWGPKSPAVRPGKMRHNQKLVCDQQADVHLNSKSCSSDALG